MVSLDILSDPVCPWCYIGKARLDRALAARPHHPLRRRWRPFRLNPEIPREGWDRRAYMKAKFGDRARTLGAQVEAAAAEAGLALALDRIARVPDTLDAHRLIRWAEGAGVQDRVVAALFRAHFEEGRDISDPAVLGAVADGAGMDGALVRDLLAGDADRAAVEEADAAARRVGVGGVPTFLLAGRYLVQGAQDTATWLRIIDELAALPAASPA